MEDEILKAVNYLESIGVTNITVHNVKQSIWERLKSLIQLAKGE